MPSRPIAKIIRTMPLLAFMVTAKMLETPARPTSTVSHGAYRAAKVVNGAVSATSLSTPLVPNPIISL